MLCNFLMFVTAEETGSLARITRFVIKLAKTKVGIYETYKTINMPGD